MGSLHTFDTRGAFKTTSWTLIVQARASEEEFGEFLRTYSDPMYRYLRAKGNSQADAEDLVQGFILKLIRNRALIERADPNRRFRNYLLTALKNYVIDQHRSSSGVPVVISTEVVDPDTAGCAASEPVAEQAFNQSWAEQVLQQVMERVKQRCIEGGVEYQWKAFEARHILPKVTGNNAMPLEEVMRTLGARDTQQVSEWADKARRKVKRALHEVVAETVDPTEVDAEVRQILTYLRPIASH